MKLSICMFYAFIDHSPFRLMVHIATVILIFLFQSAHSQHRGILDQFMTNENVSNWDRFAEKMSADETFEKIKNISLSEPFQFIDYSQEEEAYFPVDSAGTIFIDLNFDGKLDFIYQGMSGYTQKTSRYYINNGQSYHLIKNITGRTIKVDFDLKNDKVNFVVHNPPCCDSYTHSLEYYSILNNEIICNKRVLFLNAGERNISNIPAFIPVDTILLTGKIQLNLFNKEFAGSAWFGSREKTNEIMNQLRATDSILIPAGELPPNSIAYILKKKIINNEHWYCILSNGLPPLKDSLFEKWQVKTQNLNQYLGWIKTEY